jgi:sarcosine oxidase
MPTMVTYFDESAFTYILPPITYPDGKSYLKFGCHDRTKNLKTLKEVNDYFVEGPDKEKVKNLVNFAKQIIPGKSLVNTLQDIIKD